MKKNLLTVPLGIQHFGWYTLRLIAVFLFSLFCSMQANGAVIDSDNSQNDPQVTIFVSAGTVVTGTSQFSNAKVVQIPTVSPAKKVVKDKVPANFSKQIIAKKGIDDKRLKLIQEKINKRIKNSYYSSSQDSESLKFIKSKLTFAAVTAMSSFKSAQALLSNSFALHSNKTQLKKQKFYTSLSYLQFAKLRSSSLRGPPSFS